MSAVPVIRPATPGDRAALYEVCLRTGDAGADATGLFRDPELLGSVYVGPYLFMPSAVGFTFDIDGRPSGYGLGTADTRRFEAECERDWWPALRNRYPDVDAEPSTPDEEVIRAIHHKRPASEAVVAEHPAHLHIDFLPPARGIGLGRAMMDTVMTALAEAGAPGVHLDVDGRNTNAIEFYRHLGFVTIEDNVDWFVMGRRLD